jgi:hypothetical protein
MAVCIVCGNPVVHDFTSRSRPEEQEELMHLRCVTLVDRPETPEQPAPAERPSERRKRQAKRQGTRVGRSA